MKGTIRYLSAKEACDFIMPRHYAGRKPQISKAFGWEINEELVAVCTFGKPASPSLCVGICAEEKRQNKRIDILEKRELIRQLEERRDKAYVESKDLFKKW